MTIQAIINILIALAACLYGYRLNKVLIAIIGFYYGYQLGIMFLPAITLDGTLIQILSIVIALLVAIISYNMYLVGIFIICFATAYSLCSGLQIDETFRIIIGAVFGFIAGGLGVSFTRPIIIITTSLAGAYLLIDTIFKLVGFSNSLFITIGTLFVALLASSFQFSRNPEN